MQIKPFEFKPTHIDRIKTLTEELTADNEAVNMFFKLSLDLLMVADEDGTIVMANEAWCSTLKYDKLEIEQSKVFEYIHPDEVEQFIAAWYKLSDGDWIRAHYRTLVSHKEECTTLEWNATKYKNGLIYAIAREVPICNKAMRRQSIKRFKLRTSHGS
jgi:PAS domain S-box-containing protein